MSEDSLPPQVQRLLALTGQRVPIMQAPIGGASSPALAAAVARAGGLGGLALSWSAPEAAAAAVREAQDGAGGGPVFANFVLHFACEGFEAALAAGLRVVTFSWGVDAGRIARAKAAGAVVGVQVGHPQGARAALDAGAEFLIAQGVEAGGHVQSSTPLAQLLPTVLGEAGGAPVVAAGGLATGVDIARALTAGAAGAMLGTRFVATAESAAHGDYKRALVAARAEDTAMTLCFDGGWPGAAHRVLRNDTLAAWEAVGCPPPGARPGEGEVVLRRGDEDVRRYDDDAPTRGMEGAVPSAALYAGTGVGAIAGIEPAGSLVVRLWSEARAEMGVPA